MQLLVMPDGRVRGLYDETIELGAIGRVTITRGSQVEPTAEGAWIADLAPVAGPLLGPFPHRSLALAAERDWLEAHWLLAPRT